MHFHFSSYDCSTSSASQHNCSGASQHDCSGASQHDCSSASQHDCSSTSQHDCSSASQHDCSGTSQHDCSGTSQCNVFHYETCHTTSPLSPFLRHTPALIHHFTLLSLPLSFPSHAPSPSSHPPPSLFTLLLSHSSLLLSHSSLPLSPSSLLLSHSSLLLSHSSLLLSHRSHPLPPTIAECGQCEDLRLAAREDNVLRSVRVRLRLHFTIVRLYHHRPGQHWARRNGFFHLLPPGGRG